MSFKQKCEQVYSGRPRALYIHVPFCLAKCRYCDFYSLPLSAGAAERYVRAARVELTRKVPLLAGPLESIFVGGGTPTVLGAELLASLVEPAAHMIDDNTEFTIEANPGTLERGLADALAEMGVNRVSLGAQSFNDDELRLLGRIHLAAEIAKAVAALKNAGIPNISMDLIYAIPGQNLQSWRRTLGEALQQ
ncbi:MAG: radical SAM protein, partial [Planctomycetes bacterium]|nr:radical SAM protein [Planctomycetota bacterium]